MHLRKCMSHYYSYQLGQSLTKWGYKRQFLNPTKNRYF